MFAGERAEDVGQVVVEVKDFLESLDLGKDEFNAGLGGGVLWVVLWR